MDDSPRLQNERQVAYLRRFITLFHAQPIAFRLAKAFRPNRAKSEDRQKKCNPNLGAELIGASKAESAKAKIKTKSIPSAPAQAWRK